MRPAFGELEPISPYYRDRVARLESLDAQGVEACFMFPTLGVGMEAALEHDVPAMLAAFRSFNRWLEEDWGVNFQGRIFSAPYISLADVDWALAADLYVMLNIHHDSWQWIANMPGDRTNVLNRYNAIWTQLASTFRNSSPKLTLESVNEPQFTGSSGDAQNAQLLNELNTSFHRIVRASGGNVISFHECLVRIRQPDGGVLRAGAFMPEIERLGLAPLVDRQVLTQTFAVLARHPNARFSINVFPQTMQDRQWMTLGGIVGSAVLRSVALDVRAVLLAGSVVHVGKACVFGHGGYGLEGVG